MKSRVELEQQLAVLNDLRHKQGGLSYAQSFEAQQLQNEINSQPDDTPQRPAKVIRKTYDAVEMGEDIARTGNYYLEKSALTGATGPTGPTGPTGVVGIFQSNRTRARYVSGLPGPTGVVAEAMGLEVNEVYDYLGKKFPVPYGTSSLTMYPHRLSVKEARAIAGPSHGCTTGA